MSIGDVAETYHSELLADPDANELPSEHQPYAALLLSKLYHYIGQYDEAVEFALRAGEAFEREQPGEYRETIICTWPPPSPSMSSLADHISRLSRQSYHADGGWAAARQEPRCNRRGCPRGRHRREWQTRMSATPSMIFQADVSLRPLDWLCRSGV